MSKKYWSVSVSSSGEEILTIEPQMVAGRELTTDDEEIVRTAAHHLLAFIGDPQPPARKSGKEGE